MNIFATGRLAKIAIMYMHFSVVEIQNGCRYFFIKKLTLAGEQIFFSKKK